MSFLQLVLSLDKTIEGFNSIFADSVILTHIATEIISKVTEYCRMLETGVRFKGVHPHADTISFNLLEFIRKLKQCTTYGWYPCMGVGAPSCKNAGFTPGKKVGHS